MHRDHHLHHSNLARIFVITCSCKRDDAVVVVVFMDDAHTYVSVNNIARSFIVIKNVIELKIVWLLLLLHPLRYTREENEDDNFLFKGLQHQRHECKL